MGKIISGRITYSGSGVSTAKELLYDNTSSKMTATNTQAAIDELKTKLEETKKSVADGKSLLATTISDNGVTTASDATFAEINTNINTLITNKYNAGYNAGYSAGQANSNIKS